MSDIFHFEENLFSLAPKLWDLLPNSIKSSASVHEFKTKINTWTTDHCPCRICKEICRESRIHLPCSTGFAISSFLSYFYLTICTSYFLVVLHLLVLFLEISQLVFLLSLLNKVPRVPKYRSVQVP